jgi:hypothetical protein
MDELRGLLCGELWILLQQLLAKFPHQLPSTM